MQTGVLSTSRFRKSLVRFFARDLLRQYREVLPSLNRFCKDHNCNLTGDLQFPEQLLHYSMHLDPDFEYLTYGDVGARRGARMVDMVKDDLLVFYGGFAPIHPCEHKLIYALVGIFVVRKVLAVSRVPVAKWRENAHVRKKTRGPTDIVVWATAECQGGSTAVFRSENGELRTTGFGKTYSRLGVDCRYATGSFREVPCLQHSMTHPASCDG